MVFIIDDLGFFCFSLIVPSSDQSLKPNLCIFNLHVYRVRVEGKRIATLRSNLTSALNLAIS